MLMSLSRSDECLVFSVDFHLSFPLSFVRSFVRSIDRRDERREREDDEDVAQHKGMQHINAVTRPIPLVAVCQPFSRLVSSRLAVPCRIQLI